MRSFRMPPQVVRLVLLTIGIIGSYLIARSFLTPNSFGQYGWYRGEALAELSSRVPEFAGRKSCEECHAEGTTKLNKGEDKTLSCESCRGAGLAHVENPDVKMGILNVSHCIRCHEANPSRPKGL